METTIEKIRKELKRNADEKTRIQGEKFFKENVTGAPKAVYDTFERTRGRLTEAAKKYGLTISPFDLPAE